MRQFLLGTLIVLGLSGSSRTQEKAAPPKVTAPKLVQAFLTNEAHTDEYFLDQQIEVTGRLLRIARSGPRVVRTTDGAFEEKTEYLMEMDLAGAGKEDMSLVIVFDAKHRKQLADLKVAEDVTVVGRCERAGRALEIRLSDCRLVTRK